jgi:heme-degrading monooxygenase HmoA
MSEIAPNHVATTPEPPYVAVIFTAVQADGEAIHGYDAMAQRMQVMASTQPGFLGLESAGTEHEITVSYWTDQESARRWKQVAEHREAQRLGRERWYRTYRVRVATVERDYGPETAAFDT